MAIDNRLQVFNEEGQSVDYDILASDVKFMPDGKDLPTKLAEMEEEIGEGGYTPPAGGIPKTDLAPSVQQTLDDVANKVDKVPGKGLSTNDYTTEDKTKLGDLPTADQLSQQMGSKANSSDLANYATKNELTSGLSGKQNTLTFDDEPTSGSDNPVKSGGVKTALAAKANVTDVPTITQMSEAIDEAYNDAVVQVLDGETGVLDTLSSDSQTDALSANMGKRLKAAILTLLGSIGNYCFPAGKPQLILDGSTSTTFSVTYSQSDLHVTYADGQGGAAPSTVELLGGLEIQLGTNDDLYVINESTVKVFVGGNEVANAYDPTTDKIIIPQVFGNVAIIANAMTYVQDDLVLHLDYRHMGGTGTEVSGHWKSLVSYGQSPIDFTLGSGVTAADTGMVFDGGVNSYGESDSQLNLPAASCTVEAVCDGASQQFNPVLINPLAAGTVGLSIHTASSLGHRIATMKMDTQDTDVKGAALTGDSVTSFALSINTNRYRNKEEFDTDITTHYFSVSPYHTKLTIGRARRSSSDPTQDRAFTGTMRSIRVYNSVLTEDQQRRNWLVDKKRFNIQ